jgi:type IV secretory pathway protease TraF
VVAYATDGRLLIKRVAAIDRTTGSITLLGDNPSASTDSRTLGPFPATTLEAVIIAKLP